ncbi:MAG: hypothetical protein JNM39_11330 [Bdellovibrionaceae bacterium]|nr:hypothetical protein [Pseudobdellovibrionaceae bacterium]
MKKRIDSSDCGLGITVFRLTASEIAVSGGIDLDRPGRPRFIITIRYDSAETAILNAVGVND